MPGFWLGLVQLAWLHDRASEHLPELHTGCATGLLHIQRLWQLQQLHHVLKTCCCMVVCWLETWLQLGAMGMAHVAGQAGLQLLWNMWRPWVRMGLNVSFFFFFLWVRILCLLLWEGEEAQKEQTCPGLASSPRRNIISSTPSCIQGWGWVRNQQWRPAHLPLDGCCARVCSALVSPFSVNGQKQTLLRLDLSALF